MNVHTGGPYGSARFSTFNEVRAAGLLRPDGPEFGLLQGRPLHHINTGGIRITGGAGSGKTSQICIPLILSGRHVLVIFDFKNGEISRVIEPHCALLGIPLYAIDPYGVTDYPRLRVSLLSHLNSTSSTLVPDSQRFWEAILPDSGGGEAKFFEQTGRRFGDAITRKDVHLRGGTSFQSIYTLISMLRANYEAWVQWAESAPDKCSPDVATTFREMRDMYAGSPKTFDSVMAGVSNAWSFMADPRMQETLVDDDLADFPLDVIVKRQHGAAIMVIIIPDELLARLAPVLRALISSLRLIKKARPEADPVHYLIDEAARFGPFGEIGELMAIGRAAKTVPWLFYQDDAQIARNLGATGRAGIEANAGLTLDLGGGIRDYETALNRSKALGYQTLEVDDPLTQTRAESAAIELRRQVMFEGADPFEAGLRLRQLEYEASHRTKMRKALAEPEEFLNMRSDQMLVQARGNHLRPFIGNKLGYFRQRRFAGHYFPNPNEEQDMNSVSVRTLWGISRRKIIAAPLPSFLSHLPQYARGARPFRYVEGFMPKPSRRAEED